MALSHIFNLIIVVTGLVGTCTINNFSGALFRTLQDEFFNRYATGVTRQLSSTYHRN